MASTIIGVQQSEFGADAIVFPPSPLGASSSFLLDVGAFGISTAAGSTALSLGLSTSWKVTIKGSLMAQKEGILFTGALKASSITVDGTGSVYGNQFGIDVQGPVGGTPGITNSGIIAADLLTGTAIRFNTGVSVVSITNSSTGKIFGKNALVSGGKFVNFYNGTGGEIVGNFDLSATKNKVVNDGFITGDITASGWLSVTNKRVIEGKITGSAAGDDVTNSGEITGAVKLGDGTGGGTNIFKNTGEVGADGSQLSYIGDNLVDDVTNSGKLLGGVQLFGGANKVTNTGSIGGDVSSSGSLTLTNNGSIVDGGLIDGTVFGSGLADKVINTREITGRVELKGAGSGIGANSLENRGKVGEVSGLSYVGDDNKDDVYNYGSLEGGVDLGGGVYNSVMNGVGGSIGGDVSTSGALDVFNLGLIDGNVIGGGLADRVVNGNAGVIVGHVDLSGTPLGGFENNLTNSGKIGQVAGLSYIGDDGKDDVTNAGWKAVFSCGRATTS